MSKLKQLHEFISKQQVKHDHFWRAILQSDSRNIFPKHQLAKIELAKNKINKMRLIMEQLPHFLSLQLYTRNIKNIAKLVQEKDVKKDIQELSKDFQQCRKGYTSDYQFEVLEAKEKVEYFCSELSKPKIKPQIKELLNQNPKWKQYLENNTKQLKPVDAVVKERDRCDLAQFVALDKVDDCLTSGTSGKIIEERLKEEVFQFRLRQIFELKLDPKTEIPDDPWSEQWKELVSTLDEPVNFV